MVLLCLIPVIIFLVVLAALALACVAETRERQRQAEGAGLGNGIRATGEPFCVLAVADAFEPTAAPLWETQVPVLRLLSAAATRGVQERQLRALYRCARRAYPELYDGSDFVSWLEFLENSGLLVWEDRWVTITATGEEFLKYYTAAGRAVASAASGQAVQ